MVFLLRLCLVLIWVHPGSWAVDFIKSQDHLRCQVYADARDEKQAQLYTNKINNVLTDPQKIDHNRSATEEQREIIYKALFGSIMVHNTNPQYSFPLTKNDPRYQSHINALNIVNKVAYGLWLRVLAGDYVYTFDHMDSHSWRQQFSYEKSDCDKLLTKNFIRWFYEALESYRHELNFFAGMVTPEWFANVSKEFSKGRDAKEQSFKITVPPHCSYAAVFKPAHSPTHNPASRERQVQVEVVCWLLAKAAGLSHVVNPVIPVSFNKDKDCLVIDPYTPQGTLEPFVGVMVERSSFGVPNTVGRYSQDMVSFLKRSLVYSEVFKDSSPKNTFFAPTVGSFNDYFTSGSPRHPVSSCNFLQKIATSTDQKFKDLQFFNQKISVDDLASLMAFWHLTLQEDPNPSNILYRFAEDRIVPTVMDYGVALGRHQNIGLRIPSIHMLKQAKDPIPDVTKEKIQQISEKRLNQVMRGYKFEAAQKGLIQRLENIKKEFSKPHVTIRQMIHRLLPLHMTFYKNTGDQNYLLHFKKEQFLAHHSLCESKNLSLVDPLFESCNPLGSLTPIKSDNGKNWYRYPFLDYVFSADQKTFQEGENEGKNLKGYLQGPLSLVY